ncbi:MAG: hypothetical protein KDD44_09765, partial [Bdellovibrionales bacterium]|nr:hypothetical protein [Bdellovibrionales bacterium]
MRFSSVCLSLLLLYACTSVGVVSIPVGLLLTSVVSIAFILGAALWCLRRASRSDLLFWSFVFLLAFLPGAYLEYPADPWEHFYRIMRWSTCEHVTDHPQWYKYGYFWIWSFLRWLPLESRRFGLDLISGTTQLLLCIQVYRLVLQFGLTRSFARVQAVAFFFLFGTSVFGLRYYALSSTPFAYAAYLEALIVVLRVFAESSRKGPAVLETTILLVAMALNHVQTVFYFLLSVSVLCVVECFLRAEARRRVQFLAAGAAVTIVGVLLGPLAIAYYPQIYQAIGLQYVSWFGSVDVTNPRWRIMNTLGVHGFVSLSFAVIFFRRFPVLAALTLAPFLTLLWPPAVALMFQVLGSGQQLYRILYAVPTSLMLVIGFAEILRCLPIAVFRSSNDSFRASLTLGLIFVAALPPADPWGGRLYFQLYSPPAARTLQALDQAASWFIERHGLRSSCRLIADQPLRFVLATHRGQRPDVNRRRPRPL